MAVCANLIAILNVKKFFIGRGWYFTLIHTLLLGILLGLSGNMIFARGTRTFPVYAGPEQTWAAVCFESGNFINIPDIRSGFADILGSGHIQFILFLLFIALTILLLLVESLKHFGKRPDEWLQKTSMVARAIFTLMTLGVLGYLLTMYLKLRYAMEDNMYWYTKGTSNTDWNMSNVLAWAFFMKAILITLSLLFNGK